MRDIPVPYPQDLRDLSLQIEQMDERKIRYVLHRIFRNYLADKMMFDMCALARDICEEYKESEAIREKSGKVMTNREKKDWRILHNAILKGDRLALQAQHVVAVFFQLYRPSTLEVLEVVEPGRIHELWAKTLMGVILRMAGLLQTTVWRSDLEKCLRGWKIKNKEDTKEICLARLEDNTNQEVDIWGTNEQQRQKPDNFI